MDDLMVSERAEVPWIGKIPDGWSVKRLKHIFSEKKSTKNPTLSSGSISFGTVIFKDDESIPESTKESYQEVLEGEFLINPLNLNYDLKSLRIGLSRINVVVSQGYIVLKLKDGFYPQYYEYLMRKFDVEHMKSLGQGVRQTISFTHIKDEELVVPPLEEQKLISLYLDKKTEQIDRLVAKIQKKIELLTEQRTSLINQYVTKGLNPNVEMKDSGVEWIGDIPKHWNVIKINYLIKVKDGTHDTPEYVDKNEKSIPLVTSSHFVDGKIDFSNCNHISFDDYVEINKRSDVETKDIIMSMIGSNLGNSAVVGEETKFSIKNVCLFKTSKSSLVSQDFFFFLLKSECLFIQIDLNQTGGGQPFLSLDNLRNLKFPFPDLQEQNQICAVLKGKTDTISSIINNELKRISFLKEYRQSLISSIVTGKVRVTEDMI